MKRQISVLCVARNTVYQEMDNVECFDVDRDARTFDGTTPIVAHPPCRAWSAFCRHQAKPAPGEKELAPWCVEQLEKVGGVLEHPAHSVLWKTLGLPLPGERERGGMWSAAIDQSWFGDPRIKRTWLLFCGVDPAGVQFPLRLHYADNRRRWQVMSKNQRARTSREMAAWLVDVARESCIL